MTPIIYLARHASPDRSTGIRYDIAPGPPLLPQGEDEATQLGERLRDAGVVKIYASPLERTRQTAQIAGVAGDIPVEHEQELIQEHVRGEDAVDVLDRMKSFFNDAAEESAELGPVAIISHGSPIRLLVEHLGFHKEALDHYRKQFDYNNPSPPAGLWRAEQQADGTWQVALVWTPEPFEEFTVMV